MAAAAGLGHAASDPPGAATQPAASASTDFRTTVMRLSGAVPVRKARARLLHCWLVVESVRAPQTEGYLSVKTAQTNVFRR